MKKLCAQSGFTLTELIVAISVIGILSVIAIPDIKVIRNQLRISEDARSIALILGELRAESIRLKRSTRIVFNTAGVSWDYYNDGTIDGSYTLQSGVTWQSIPSSITFNGFGLLRGLSNDATLRLSAGSLNQPITINKNGHLEL